MVIERVRIVEGESHAEIKGTAQHRARGIGELEQKFGSRTYEPQEVAMSEGAHLRRAGKLGIEKPPPARLDFRQELSPRPGPQKLLSPVSLPDPLCALVHFVAY